MDGLCRTNPEDSSLRLSGRLDENDHVWLTSPLVPLTFRRALIKKETEVLKMTIIQDVVLQICTFAILMSIIWALVRPLWAVFRAASDVPGFFKRSQVKNKTTVSNSFLFKKHVTCAVVLETSERGPDVPVVVVFDCLFVERHASRQEDWTLVCSAASKSYGTLSPETDGNVT